MFDKINDKLSQLNGKKHFIAVLQEAVNEEIGEGEAGILPDEEEMLVDPDSIPDEVLEKIMSQVDGLVGDDDLDSEIMEAIGDEEEFEGVE